MSLKAINMCTIADQLLKLACTYSHTTLCTYPQGGDSKAPVIIPIVGDRGYRGPNGHSGQAVSLFCLFN